MRQYIIFLLIFMVANMGLNAQLNNYKYIIVPKKFDAFRSENHHQTSTLIKYLFTKKGFNTVYQDDFPEDLKNDLCLGLRVTVDDRSSLFKTRMALILKDCQRNEVFRTHEGTSKSKSYREAYHEAIRDAFTSFDIIDYVYEPETKTEQKQEEPITVSFKNDVKNLEEAASKAVVVQEATQEEQSFKRIVPKDSDVLKAEPQVENNPLGNLLYALRTETGYNLVDSAAKIKFKLLDTSVENIFLLDRADMNGVVFQKDGKWYIETKGQGKKELKELNIKF